MNQSIVTNHQYGDVLKCGICFFVQSSYHTVFCLFNIHSEVQPMKTGSVTSEFHWDMYEKKTWENTLARHAGPSYFPASFFRHQHDQPTHPSNSNLHEKGDHRYDMYAVYVNIYINIALSPTVMFEDRDYLWAILDPKTDTWFRDTWWRLDYASKPPTAKQIGLNRCSFGDANKNARYNLRLWTKQWSPICHGTYLEGPHCVAAWKADQVSFSVSQELALQEVVETLFKVFFHVSPNQSSKGRRKHFWPPEDTATRKLTG